MRVYRSYSSADTERLGERLARAVVRGGIRGRRAVAIALEGDLGAGKTTFVQGFVHGLGISPKKAASPTFIIMRRIPLRGRAQGTGREAHGPSAPRDLRFTNLYHADAYRIERLSELRHLGFHEALHNPQNIIVIEWADRIRRALPRSAIRVRFGHGKKENERTMKLHNLS